MEPAQQSLVIGIAAVVLFIILPAVALFRLHSAILACKYLLEEQNQLLRKRLDKHN